MRTKESRSRKRTPANPLWKWHVLLPAFAFLLFFAGSVATLVLLSFPDAERYVGAAAGCFAGGLAALLLAPVLTKPLLKRAAAIEAERFDFAPQPQKERYVYFQSLPVGAFTAPALPFPDLEPSPVEGRGTENFRVALRRLAGEKYTPFPPARPLPDATLLLFDESPDNRYARFRIAWTEENGGIRAEIEEPQELVLAAEGVYVNGVFFPYEEVRITVEGGEQRLRAQIGVSFLCGGEHGVTVFLPLDGTLLTAMRQFSLSPENEEALRFLLDHPEKALYQILKYGSLVLHKNTIKE